MLYIYKYNITYIHRGRNNSRISGSQQDYLVGKSGSPQIYLVVIWPRFKQHNMTNTTLQFRKIFPNVVVVHRTTAVIIFGSPTKFLVVLGLPLFLPLIHMLLLRTFPILPIAIILYCKSPCFFFWVSVAVDAHAIWI